jgi:hypothetical protein
MDFTRDWKLRLYENGLVHHTHSTKMNKRHNEIRQTIHFQLSDKLQPMGIFIPITPLFIQYYLIKVSKHNTQAVLIHFTTPPAHFNNLNTHMSNNTESSGSLTQISYHYELSYWYSQQST